MRIDAARIGLDAITHLNPLTKFEGETMKIRVFSRSQSGVSTRQSRWGAGIVVGARLAS